MAYKLAFSCFIMAFVIANVMAAERYSKNANRVDKMDDIDKASMMGGEFRSRQVIQVWQKADRMNLAQNKMKELHRDLLRIDGMYHKMKKEATSDQNDNKIRSGDDTEMAVQKQLGAIMKRYGMAGGAGPNEKLKFNREMEMPFEDRKVAQLWHKAQKSNQFSKQELEELKQELSKHDERQKEFNTLMEEVHGEDGAKSNSADRFANKKPEEIRQIRIKEMELKLQHREMAKEYERISVKTMPKEERGPFTERRVISLWQEAKKQDFSTEDLEAIMGELKEFEERVEEHDKRFKAKLQFWENIKSYGELKEFEERVEEHDKAHRASLDSEIRHRSGFKSPVDNMKTNDHKNMYDRAKELGVSIHHSMKELRHRISKGGKWNTEL